MSISFDEPLQGRNQKNYGKKKLAEKYIEMLKG
jgi:hypothetical protein